MIYVESYIVIQAVYDCLFIDFYIMPLCQFSIFKFHWLPPGDGILHSLSASTYIGESLPNSTGSLVTCRYQETLHTVPAK